MKPVLRIATMVALSLLFSGFLHAQTAQVGDVVVGTCDGTQPATQDNDTDVYTPLGQLRLSLPGPSLSSCLTGMTFDGNDNLRIISAQFGTQNWNVLEFDNHGNLIAQSGPYVSPTSIVHDQQGNFYLSAGNIIKISPNGATSTISVAGGAKWVALASDQNTLIYAATNGNVKSFDLSTLTQGPDLTANTVARIVRVLPDNTLLIDANGAVTHWIKKCGTCTAYKQVFAYPVPANADSFALDPDGASFWTINTFYDAVAQLGHADVYRMNISTGQLMAQFSLPALSGGRFYSGSIGVNGDGMNSTASATASVTFGAQLTGTVSSAKPATIANTGPAELIVSKVVITDDFAIKTNNCAKGLLPGASCNINITFSPSQAGTRTGTLTVFANASHSPLVTALSGDGQEATNISLESSLNPSTYGQIITLTVIVSTSGSPATGTVTFLNGTRTLGKVTLVGGSASLNVSNLPVGTQSLTAKYSGDTLNQRGTSPVLTQVVSQATTTTTLVSSRNPSKKGQSVRFTATIQSPTAIPTGPVTFTAGTVVLGTANVGGGKATISTAALPAGTNTVTATYGGTANIQGSSGSVIQTVN